MKENKYIEEYTPQYKEYICTSFQDAVETMIGEDTEENERFILLDIDGVLFNDIDKLPIYALLNNSKIEDDDQTYMMYLKEIYKDKLAIVTDRNPHLNLFLSSKYIINKVEEVNVPNEERTPIFHSLNKQFCNISIKEKEKLIDHIAKSSQGKQITLTSIEDHTFTVPSRDRFLLYITKELYQKYGIEIDIENYVIKK